MKRRSVVASREAGPSVGIDGMLDVKATLDALIDDQVPLLMN
jgi:hypothetical protein